MSTYYLRRNGTEVTGPFTSAQLRNLAMTHGMSRVGFCVGGFWRDLDSGHEGARTPGDFFRATGSATASSTRRGGRSLSAVGRPTDGRLAIRMGSRSVSPNARTSILRRGARAIDILADLALLGTDRCAWTRLRRWCPPHGISVCSVDLRAHHPRVRSCPARQWHRCALRDRTATESRLGIP